MFKIGIDGSRSFILNRTGTENYAFQLLKAISQIDQVNQYIIYLRPGNQYDPKEWPSNFEFKMLKYPFLWTQLGLSLQTWIEKLDLLFVPSHTLPLFRPASLKTVMTIHDLGAEYLPLTHQLKQRLYLKFITNIQMRSATKLIAVSQSTKSDLIKIAKCSPRQIEVIYEGVDQTSPELIKKDILVNLLSDLDIVYKRYFLFVGTVQPRKNIGRLIKAFDKLLKDHPQKYHDYKLVIAGGRGWLSEEIYSLPQELKIESQVKFLGRVSDQLLASLYQGAIALTFPSLFEGFGLPVLEAYRYQLPVVTSKQSSLPEVAGEGAILVDPYDINAIAQGMHQVTDIKSSQQLISAGQHQLKQFSWHKAAIETIKLFEEVINE